MASAQDTLAATRLVVTDIFHAFGAPEVRGLRPDGALRVRYFDDRRELTRWAEAQNVETTGETVD